MLAVPTQVHLVVADLRRSLPFYRLLGWELQVTGPHAEVVFDNGFSVELDEDASVALWNRGAPPRSAGSTVLTVAVETRRDVDRLWDRVTLAGHESRQRPFDAFWGSRFAVVADPDGHQLAITSPVDGRLRSWPPVEPPA